jgi:hypothetical protein
MRRLLGDRAWSLAAAIVSLAAAVTALYVQLFEVRAREEDSRLAALRLESALTESRSRLKDEILAELRAGGLGKGSADGDTGGLAPGAILRRPDLGRSSGTERPGLESALLPPPMTLSGIALGLQDLTRQTRETDRALRRDLAEFRAATRRELDTGGKVSTLTLIAVIPLAVLLLLAVRRSPPRSDDAASG